MQRTAARVSLLFVLLLAYHPVANAHHLTVQQVLDGLNSDGMKKQAGVEEAAVDKKVTRLLWIRIGPRWYKLTDLERERLAVQWLKMWKDAVPNGIVSVVDLVTSEPVVSYHPSGKVTFSVHRASP